MTYAIAANEKSPTVPAALGRSAWVLLLFGAVLVVVAFVVPLAVAKSAFLAAGLGILTVGLLAVGWNGLSTLAMRRELAVIERFCEPDRTSLVITDREGIVKLANSAAAARLGVAPGCLLGPSLAGLFASPFATMQKLIGRAAVDGSAREDRVSRQGQVRLTATGARGGLFLWRLEDVSPSDAVMDTADRALPAAVMAESGKLLSVNGALVALVGTGAETLGDIISGGVVDSGQVHTLTTSEGPMPFRVLEICGDGTNLSELYFLPVDFGSSESSQILFDTLPVPLLKIAADGGVVIGNQSACHLLGREIPEGTWLSDLVSGLGRSVTDWLQEAAAGRGLNQSEFLQVRGHESDLFVQVTLKRVVEEGKVRLVAVLTDATELKTLEAQFVQSQKMQAIGQLAGGVAHDFNNLLTAISGHCDLLLLRHDQGDPEYGDLVQIHQNANRAASLVGQLLAFSRKQTLQPETIDLRDVLSDLTHLLSRLVGERVQLTLRHLQSLSMIRADKRQLEQVIMNLVVNARDAMPEGGDVVLETDSVHLTQELRRNRAVVPSGDYVVVRVIDQGTGIPLENLQKIFEPFYTTKKTGEGTGLGLSTAYGIIKQTGGFIFADSGQQGGTVFTLYFPAHVEDDLVSVDIPRPEAPTVAERTGGVVLLVEDEAPVRAFASRALRLRGYTVLEAESGEEALEILVDPDLHVDIFVTDVVMPGLDGPSWVRRALEKRPDTEVVFVSGYAEDALSDHQDRIPNSIFLPKPFSLQDLTNTVQAQLA